MGIRAWIVWNAICEQWKAAPRGYRGGGVIFSQSTTGCMHTDSWAKYLSGLLLFEIDRATHASRLARLDPRRGRGRWQGFRYYCARTLNRQLLV